MSVYRVGIREIWIRTVVVNAENAEQAMQKAADIADNEEFDSEFVGYGDPNTWEARLCECPACKQRAQT